MASAATSAAKSGSRLSRIGSTLWEHKKKTAFAGFLAYLAGDFTFRWQRNSKIRGAYAQLAVKYGEQVMSAEDRPRRVCILANVSANERHCYDEFTKNALPLLHMAGIQVEIIKSDSESQLEALAAAVDHEEADAVYVVGGDGTLGRVVTGILRNREKPVLPIGVFPGGYDNLTMKRLVPSVFQCTEDVRRFCESAMSLIEDRRQSVAAFEVTLDDSPDQKPLYSIGDVGAGWFRHTEDRRKKMWYFGPLKRRWAHIWEMIKRSPENLSVSVVYEEHCDGCRSCRLPVVFEQPPWRWWHILTGSPRFKLPDVMSKDYSEIVNDNCGRLHELEASGTDLILENEQREDSARMRLRVGGTGAGRLSTIAEGWGRIAADVVGTSKSPSFYTTDVLARNVRMQFTRIPEFISRIYVSSDPVPITEGQTVRVRATDKRLDLYLPTCLRIDPTTL